MEIIRRPKLAYKSNISNLNVLLIPLLSEYRIYKKNLNLLHLNHPQRGCELTKSNSVSFNPKLAPDLTSLDLPWCEIRSY